MTRLIALAVLAASTAAHATDQHNDVLLLINGDGELVTGVVDFDAGTVTAVDERIFTDEFDPFCTTDAPGFNALSSGDARMPAGFSALPSGTVVSFDALAFTLDGADANLFFWDGTGAPAFAPATQVDLEASKSPAFIFNALIDGSANDVAGFDIDTAASSGFVHKHVDFILLDLNAPSGVYVFSLGVTAGPLTADPIYIAHAWGTAGGAQLDAARAAIQSQLIDVAPACPTDTDGSGTTDLADLLTVLANFGTASGSTQANGDTDADGDVQLDDLLAVLAAFGQPC